MKLLNNPKLFRHLMNLWPPFLGAGIRVRHISIDWRRITVELRQFGINRNYMGTHFGGSLFAMTDPFYMLMLIKNLGRKYNVWDKSGSIEFIRPTNKKVTATFALDAKRITAIHSATAGGDKHLETFNIDVTDPQGRLTARVCKTIYVRKVI